MSSYRLFSCNGMAQHRPGDKPLPESMVSYHCWSDPQDKSSIKNKHVFCQENPIEKSVACQISTILLKPQCVSPHMWRSSWSERESSTHYNDVIMSLIASQITGVTIVQSFDQAQVKETSKLRVTGLCVCVCVCGRQWCWVLDAIWSCTFLTMNTTWHGNSFRVTGPLRRESNGFHHIVPLI